MPALAVNTSRSTRNKVVCSIMFSSSFSTITNMVEEKNPRQGMNSPTSFEHLAATPMPMMSRTELLACVQQPDMRVLIKQRGKIYFAEVREVDNTGSNLAVFFPDWPDEEEQWITHSDVYSLTPSISAICTSIDQKIIECKASWSGFKFLIGQKVVVRCGSVARIVGTIKARTLRQRDPNDLTRDNSNNKFVAMYLVESKRSLTDTVDTEYYTERQITTYVSAAKKKRLEKQRNANTPKLLGKQKRRLLVEPTAKALKKKLKKQRSVSESFENLGVGEKKKRKKRNRRASHDSPLNEICKACEFKAHSAHTCGRRGKAHNPALAANLGLLTKEERRSLKIASRNKSDSVLFLRKKLMKRKWTLHEDDEDDNDNNANNDDVDARAHHYHHVQQQQQQQHHHQQQQQYQQQHHLQEEHQRYHQLTDSRHHDDEVSDADADADDDDGDVSMKTDSSSSFSLHSLVGPPSKGSVFEAEYSNSGAHQHQHHQHQQHQHHFQHHLQHQHHHSPQSVSLSLEMLSPSSEPMVSSCATEEALSATVRREETPPSVVASPTPSTPLIRRRRPLPPKRPIFDFQDLLGWSPDVPDSLDSQSQFTPQQNRHRFSFTNNNYNTNTNTNAISNRNNNKRNHSNNSSNDTNTNSNNVNNNSNNNDCYNNHYKNAKLNNNGALLHSSRPLGIHNHKVCGTCGDLDLKRVRTSYNTGAHTCCTCLTLDDCAKTLALQGSPVMDVLYVYRFDKL